MRTPKARARVLITFSGLDGAGKSTLIAWLRKELEGRDRAVTVLHMTDDVGVYACLRGVRDRLRRGLGDDGGAPPGQPRWAGTPPSPDEGRTVGSRLRTLARRVRTAILWNRPIRRLLYPLDLAIFAAVRCYVEAIRGRVLIMDRYFYDTLVDVADDGRWFWVRLLERLTPTPDVPVFLDITPEESYARKGEYSVPYLALRGAAYRAVAPLVPSALVLQNVDLASSQQALAQAVSRFDV